LSGPHEPTTASGSVALALSPEDRARVEQVEALAQDGPNGVAELLGLLAEPSWAVRRSVVAALASRGDAAVPGLVQILEEQRDDESRLAAAVDALVASRGGAVEATMMNLASGATTPPPLVCDVVQVLGRRRAHAAVPRLAELSTHADDNVAVAAIEALGRIGGTDTVEALASAVESRQFFRAFPAIDALGRTGDVRAVAPLTALLGDPLYAPEAARALGHTGNESAVAPLARLLPKQTNALVQIDAVALAELRERYEGAYGEVPAMTQALGGAISPPEGSARLIAALPGVSTSELLAIARVLGWLGDPVAIEQLVELVMIESASSAAADALRRLGTRATPHLLAHITAGDSARRLRLLPIVGYAFARIDELLPCLADPDPEVRVKVCEALARAGDPAAVTSLFGLIGDRDGAVSQAAAAAIQSLGSLETRRLALEQARSEDMRARRAALRIVS